MIKPGEERVISITYAPQSSEQSFSDERIIFYGGVPSGYGGWIFVDIDGRTIDGSGQ